MLGVGQSRGPKLFGREIIFEEFQPMLASRGKNGPVVHVFRLVIYLTSAAFYA